MHTSGRRLAGRRQQGQQQLPAPAVRLARQGRQFFQLAPDRVQHVLDQIAVQSLQLLAEQFQLLHFVQFGLDFYLGIVRARAQACRQHGSGVARHAMLFGKGGRELVLHALMFLVDVGHVVLHQGEIARIEQAQAERDAAARREQALIEQAAQAQRDADQKAREAETAAANQALQLQLAAEQAERLRIQAEADRVAGIQQAERERVAAEQRQAAAVERARLAEIARQEAEAVEQRRLAEAREADKAHKGAIYKAAKEAFMDNNMTEDCARLAVKLIASGMIPNIKITY